jgi:polysaccharide chain length determinant protein (PEP-CTERM system associated)
MDKVYIKDMLYSLKAELIRFRVWCVLLFILTSFAVLGVGMIVPKKYSAGALLVADATNIIEPLLKGRAEVTKVDRTEQAKEVIYTRGLLEQVARQAGMVGENADPNELARAVRTLRSNLVIKGEKNNFFRVSYSASDPDAAFEVVNNVINIFIEDSARKKREESLAAYNFIDTQVQAYRRQLELAEQRLKDFKGQNLDGTEATVTARIVQLRNEIEALKISIEETQARITTIQQQLSSEGQYLQVKSQVDDMRQRKQTLSSQLEQLLLSYQENYPDVISLRSQIADLDAAIEQIQSSGEVYGNASRVENPLYEELRKQLQAADVDLRGQKRRMQSLIHLQEQEYERAQRIAANQAELSELTRDYNVTQSVYDEMLQRKENARLSMSLDMEGQGINYRIQEPATFPLYPIGLRFLHFVIAGPFLGLLLPLGLLVLYVLMDPHLRSARTLQQQLPSDVELLGVIPHYHSPLGERLLRKDMLLLLLLCILAMGAYFGLAVYWHSLRG